MKNSREVGDLQLYERWTLSQVLFKVFNQKYRAITVLNNILQNASCFRTPSILQKIGALWKSILYSAIAVSFFPFLVTCEMENYTLIVHMLSKTLFLTQEIRIIHLSRILIHFKNTNKKPHSNSNKNDLKYSKISEAKPKCLT